MDINFKELEKGLVDVLKGSVSGDAAKITEFSKKIIEEQKETLKKLAELMAAGSITAEELISELEDEKVTIQNLYLSLKVAAKASAQKATNAALKFLGDSIIGIVKAAI
jgi:hypothetical protein